MKAIRWGIIGCGDVTEVKSGPAFRRAGGAELTYVMRRTEAKVRNYASRHDVPNWTTDAQKLIESDEVDAVYVATPPGAHEEYVLASIRAGKPVYVEKPLSATIEQGESMVRAAKEAGVPLFCAYYRRALPRFLKVKELLEADVIGEVRSVSVQLLQPRRQGKDYSSGLPWRLQKEHAGGGLFIDLGSHALDLLDYLLGPAEEAHGFAVNQAGDYEVEDCLSATLRFPKNVVGTGLWCFTSSVRRTEESITIEGATGRIRFTCYGENDPVTLLLPDRAEDFNIPHPAHIQEPLIKKVVQALRGEGESPSTGETALRTTRLMACLVGNRPYRRNEFEG